MGPAMAVRWPQHNAAGVIQGPTGPVVANTELHNGAKHRKKNDMG